MCESCPRKRHGSAPDPKRTNNQMGRRTREFHEDLNCSLVVCHPNGKPSQQSQTAIATYNSGALSVSA